MKRQAFIKAGLTSMAGLGFIPSSLGFRENSYLDMNFIGEYTEADKLPDNEKYWDKIAAFFEKPVGINQLEHGYFSHQPEPTISAHLSNEISINQRTSLFMRLDQENAIEQSRRDLANFLGVDAEELVITRNTTESLNIVIMGFPWKAGDEVIIGNQDYGSMVEAFEQAAERFGIVIKVAEIPLIPKNDQEIIEAYWKLVTPATKMIHLTHTINLTGQVIPVNQICEHANQKGIVTVVDAAHSTAHIIEKIGSIQADFIGGSLHKWLCTPLGLGYLVMKKEFIPRIWPLFGDRSQAKTNIRRFEHQGTRPIHSIQTLKNAIDFHNMIGFDAKRKRLNYLKSAWTKAIDGQNGLTVISPWEDFERGGAIATVQSKKLTPSELAQKLFKEFKIFTVAINHPVVKGVRITPHLSTSIVQINQLNEILMKI